MVMTKMYARFCGILAHESASGVGVAYVGDTLTSLVAALSSSGSVLYSTAYWPFGEPRDESGSVDSPWRFVGLIGYYQDLAVQFYVRARHLSAVLAQWLTSDPIWPARKAYTYAHRPMTQIDPSGLAYIPIMSIGCSLRWGSARCVTRSMGLFLQVDGNPPGLRQ